MCSAAFFSYFCSSLTTFILMLLIAFVVVDSAVPQARIASILSALILSLHLWRKHSGHYFPVLLLLLCRASCVPLYSPPSVSPSTFDLITVWFPQGAWVICLAPFMLLPVLVYVFHVGIDGVRPRSFSPWRIRQSNIWAFVLPICMDASLTAQGLIAQVCI